MNNEILKDAQFIRENCRNIEEWGYRALKERKQPSYYDKFILIPEMLMVSVVSFFTMIYLGAEHNLHILIGLVLIYELPMFILTKISNDRMIITLSVAGFFVSGGLSLTNWSLESHAFVRYKNYLLFFIILGYVIFIIRYVFSVSKKASDKKALAAIHGTITEKVYDTMHKYDLDKYFKGKDDLEFWKIYIKEIDKIIKYPPLEHVKYDSNRNRLLQSYLNTNMFQQVIIKQGQDSFDELRKCFKMLDKSFKVQNHIHEKYLVCIKELASSMPSFPCNILSLSKLCENPVLISLTGGNSLAVETPHFTEYMSKYNDSIKYLVDLHSRYKNNWMKFNNDYKGTIIGESGERAVLEELKFFSNQMKILTNIRLEVNDQSVESDIICVCPQGIFALEVKNLGSTGSYNITVEKDGLWKKVMKNGRWKAMGSVSKQNIRHLHGIEQVVNSKMNNSIENWITARSIIVFANDVIGIRNYSENVIVRASEMMNEIRKYPQSLNEKQINQIADILQAESLSPKKYETENWGQSIIGLKLEIIEKTNQLLTTIKPCLDIINSYAKIPDYKEPFDFNASEEVFDVTLADDISDYQKSNAEIAKEIELARRAGEEEERRLEEIRRSQEEEDVYYEEELCDMDKALSGDMDYLNPYSREWYYHDK